MCDLLVRVNNNLQMVGNRGGIMRGQIRAHACGRAGKTVQPVPQANRENRRGGIENCNSDILKWRETNGKKANMSKVCMWFGSDAKLPKLL